MRLDVTLLMVSLMLGTSVCEAASSDAREVARINNCSPKKIEVYQQTLGIDGKTVYRVACNIPKAKDEKAGGGADSLLIECTGSLCGLLRSMSSDQKN